MSGISKIAFDGVWKVQSFFKIFHCIQAVVSRLTPGLGSIQMPFLGSVMISMTNTTYPRVSLLFCSPGVLLTSALEFHQVIL